MLEIGLRVFAQPHVHGGDCHQGQKPYEQERCSRTDKCLAANGHLRIRARFSPDTPPIKCGHFRCRVSRSERSLQLVDNSLIDVGNLTQAQRSNVSEYSTQIRSIVFCAIYWAAAGNRADDSRNRIARGKRVFQASVKLLFKGSLVTRCPGTAKRCCSRRCL